MKAKTIRVNDRMQKGYRYALTEPIGKHFDARFKPQLTPKRMLSLGVFGGVYMRDCGFRYGARRGGFTKTIRAAGSNGIAATIWAADVRMTSGSMKLALIVLAVFILSLLRDTYFGGNTKKESIAMTAPVTANVDGNSHTISFGMPRSYTLVTGSPQYAGYNAPWTPPWMMRNEVMVSVQ